MTIKKFFLPQLFIFLSAISFFSCSLKYEDSNSIDKNTPEFTFKNASYSKYENNKKTMQLKADKLEQYKSDGAYFAQNVNFNTWDKNENLQSTGKCQLLGADTKKELYLLFNDISIQSEEQNLSIIAQSLKYDGKTEQLTSAQGDTVFIKRDDLSLEGQGFSASGVSKQFKFNSKISGTLETQNKNQISESKITNEEN